MSGRVRVKEWEENLAAALAAALDEPFQLGVHDCGSFACDVAEALTGQRPAPWLTGYSTQEELDALLAAHGGGVEGATVMTGGDAAGGVTIARVPGRDGSTPCIFAAFAIDADSFDAMIISLPVHL